MANYYRINFQYYQIEPDQLLENVKLPGVVWKQSGKLSEEDSQNYLNIIKNKNYLPFITISEDEVYLEHLDDPVSIDPEKYIELIWSMENDVPTLRIEDGVNRNEDGEYNIVYRLLQGDEYAGAKSVLTAAASYRLSKYGVDYRLERGDATFIRRLDAMKSQRKTLYLFIAAALILLSSFLPCPEGLTRQGMQSFGIILASIVLWVTETMNMAVTGIFMATLLVFMKILSPNDMFKGFGGSVFFFMVGTMSITTAMASCSGRRNRPASWWWASASARRCCRRSCRTSPPARCSHRWGWRF